MKESIESILYRLWSEIHVDRFLVERGEKTAPDNFYAGSVHAANIVLKKLNEITEQA